MATQGGQANRSGNTLERTVMATLESKGFGVVRYRDWVKHPDQYGDELIIRHVPYESMYNHRGYSEFLVLSAKHGFKMRIECKWQQTAGSVDEKYPYLYLNCVEKMPEQDIIIIADGGGAKDGAISWLRMAAKEKLYQRVDQPKNIQVMNLVEFLIWTNNTFR